MTETSISTKTREICLLSLFSLIPAILSLMANKFHLFRVFLIPGFVLAFLYSLLTNGSGPEGWGNKEVMIMIVGNTAAYVLMGVYLVYRKLAMSE